MNEAGVPFVGDVFDGLIDSDGATSGLDVWRDGRNGAFLEVYRIRQSDGDSFTKVKVENGINVRIGFCVEGEEDSLGEDAFEMDGGFGSVGVEAERCDGRTDLCTVFIFDLCHDFIGIDDRVDGVGDVIGAVSVAVLGCGIEGGFNCDAFALDQFSGGLLFNDLIGAFGFLVGVGISAKESSASNADTCEAG